ncbi:MAG TPA: efflux RND transporter permease subunit [Thermoanaerobaculia bacterium]|nr:efflux RND transporter permease subunit [Thermoanaerobaculia bacterium]
MSHQSQEDLRNSKNTARFFVENRHIAWVLLLGTALWGWVGFTGMPQRKDPDVPVRVAVALAQWPGAPVDRVEQLVTRKIEQKIAENAKVDEIKSVTRTGLSVVYVTLVEGLKETGKEFDDIKLKLDAIEPLPSGAGPVMFIKDFGDTAALMLTIASPPASGLEIKLRARDVRQGIEQARAAAPKGSAPRVSIVACYPKSIPADSVARIVSLFQNFIQQGGATRNARVLQGPGFCGLDEESSASDAELQRAINNFFLDKVPGAEIHPDTWRASIVRDPAKTEEVLAASAGDKYTYRELDDFTDLITRTLQGVPQVARVTRSGVLDERVYLEYSQTRLAAYGLQNTDLSSILAARNITAPGGVVAVGGKNLAVDPTGELTSESEIGGLLVATSQTGSPVYLRDVAEVIRAYEGPARFLNFYNYRDKNGKWHRTRAITLAVQMRSGQKIAELGKAVDAALKDVQARLPEDLIYARTSDQPLQVSENIHLFMNSLYEAIALVVLVSLVGFWEWRSALLMALSIPITLAMTFGMVHLFGIDLQQVSIASLIIALGLLVDDPVVAGDAIKRELALGTPRLTAAWLGPLKLATAILYATITNIVAYLPFLALTGDTGAFMKSLPIVIGCSLLASRIVSMTFIPLLGYYILRPTKEKPIEERRKSGFASFYYRVGNWAIDHRKRVLVGALVLLVGGLTMAKGLKEEFFPKDLSYLSFIDVWLPEDAPLIATRQAVDSVERIVHEIAAEYGREHAGKDAKPKEVLESVTSFIGGGGPRFWFSVSPELSQLNYAQVLIQTRDKHDTGHLIAPLQAALSSRVPGARIDVRQLDSGSAVGIPIQIRISGEDIPTLRTLSARLETTLREMPETARVRNDWGSESFSVRLTTDPDRANLAGVTNLDVAQASSGGLNGVSVGSLREGDKKIPIVARLRMEERAELSDLADLYVYSHNGTSKVPLGSVSSISYGLKTEKMWRRNHFRTVTVSAFSHEGFLPAEVLKKAMPAIHEFEKSMPPGYTLEIAGEHKEKTKSFKNLLRVMMMSVAMIFLALVIQFKNAVKPFIVFAAIPFGFIGAFAALWIMKMPFGFMAFMGVASLIGVIVSHVIVLFDFIEEKHAEGEPLEQALLDAGIMRLRPVLITVGATVIALFPLAAHGGPLWEPMCYAQIGGLTIATVVTLLLVPVIYAIFVKDLKIVKWEAAKPEAAGASKGAPALPPLGVEG